MRDNKMIRILNKRLIENNNRMIENYFSKIS